MLFSMLAFKLEPGYSGRLPVSFPRCTRCAGELASLQLDDFPCLGTACAVPQMVLQELRKRKKSRLTPNQQDR